MREIYLDIGKGVVYGRTIRKNKGWNQNHKKTAK